MEWPVPSSLEVGATSTGSTSWPGVGKKPISREDLERTHAQLEQATHAEKLNRFGLKPDRADVIVPACRIYLDAMDLFGADTVIVPKVGLGDGMVLELHRQRTG